ncbi:hypothetical protein S83_071858 [Arachis hypogaea]
MSFSSISLFLSIFFFLLFFIPSSSLSLSSFPSSSSSSNACKSTLYPKLCRTILSTIRNSPSDPYGYGKFSIKQSLKQATKLEKVFNDFLNRHNRQSNNNSSSLNNAEVSAIVDCKDLNKLNVDYLSSISAELKYANNNANGAAELVDKIESYLSAVATNHETVGPTVGSSRQPGRIRGGIE